MKQTIQCVQEQLHCNWLLGQYLLAFAGMSLVWNRLGHDLQNKTLLRSVHPWEYDQKII